MGISVNVASKADFNIALTSIKKQAITGSSHEEVIEKIDLMVNTLNDVGTMLLAKNDAGSVVGLLTMTKRPVEWFIDDLVSFQKGAGSALVDFAIDHATKDSPGKPINLISLDENSTKFWTSKKFVVNGSQDVKGKNIGMKRNVQ